MNKKLKYGAIALVGLALLGALVGPKEGAKTNNSAAANTSEQSEKERLAAEKKEFFAGFDSEKLAKRMWREMEESRKDGSMDKTGDIPQYSAASIYRDYENNEVAADGKYRDKWFLVSGKVSEIAKDFRDKPYLTFAMDSYGIASVRADLFEEQICGITKGKGATSCSAIERAAKIKKGQAIDLECKGGGMMMKTPMLKECLISF